MSLPSFFQEYPENPEELQFPVTKIEDLFPLKTSDLFDKNEILLISTPLDFPWVSFADNPNMVFGPSNIEPKRAVRCNT